MHIWLSLHGYDSGASDQVSTSNPSQPLHLHDFASTGSSALCRMITTQTLWPVNRFWFAQHGGSRKHSGRKLFEWSSENGCQCCLIRALKFFSNFILFRSSLHEQTFIMRYLFQCSLKVEIAADAYVAALHRCILFHQRLDPPRAYCDSQYVSWCV